MVIAKKLLYTTLMAVAATALARGQEQKRVNFGIEFGSATYVSDIKDNPNIRATNSISYFDDNGCSDLYANTYRYHYGVKAELLSSNQYLGIATGIRFTQIKSKVYRDDWFSNNDKVYILYNQDGVNTEYAQVTGIRQQASYLGIPLDIRCFTMRPRFFRLYLKLGFDLSLKISDRTSVTFQNSIMNPYQKQVSGVLGTPASVLSTINPGIGFKLGDKDGVSVSMEVNAPTFIMSSNASSFASNNMGVGAQIFVSFPIK